jgi:hypothetical protein
VFFHFSSLILNLPPYLFSSLLSFFIKILHRLFYWPKAPIQLRSFSAGLSSRNCFSFPADSPFLPPECQYSPFRGFFLYPFACLRLGVQSLRPFSMAIICLLPLIFSLNSVPNAHSAQVVLQWDPNTEPNLAGYKIYYGTSSRNYEFSAYVGDITTYTVSNLPDGGTYYFAATAIDSSNLESGYSNEVVYSSDDCLYSLSPATQSFSSSGGAGTVAISTGAGCPWTAVNNASWIIISSNSSGTGGSTVNYSIAENPSSASRSGMINIGGQILTVTQSGSSSGYSTSSSNTYSIKTSAGRNGSISPQGTVTVNSGGNKTFTITPASGYRVRDVKVDGVSVGAVGSYLFGNVGSSHTISASFIKLNVPHEKSPGKTKRYFSTEQRN